MKMILLFLLFAAQLHSSQLTAKGYQQQQLTRANYNTIHVSQTCADTNSLESPNDYYTKLVKFRPNNIRFKDDQEGGSQVSFSTIFANQPMYDTLLPKSKPFSQTVSRTFASGKDSTILNVEIAFESKTRLKMRHERSAIKNYGSGQKLLRFEPINVSYIFLTLISFIANVGVVIFGIRYFLRLKAKKE